MIKLSPVKPPPDRIKRPRKLRLIMSALLILTSITITPFIAPQKVNAYSNDQNVRQCSSDDLGIAFDYNWREQLEDLNPYAWTKSVIVTGVEVQVAGEQPYHTMNVYIADHIEFMQDDDLGTGARFTIMQAPYQELYPDIFSVGRNYYYDSNGQRDDELHPKNLTPMTSTLKDRASSWDDDGQDHIWTYYYPAIADEVDGDVNTSWCIYGGTSITYAPEYNGMLYKDELPAQNLSCDGALDIGCHVSNMTDKISTGISTALKHTLNGIARLFIPPEGFFADIVSEMQEEVGQQFGFLFYPIEFILDIFDAIIFGDPNGKLNINQNLLGKDLKQIDFTFIEQTSPTAMHTLRITMQAFLLGTVIFGIKRQIEDVLDK